MPPTPGDDRLSRISTMWTVLRAAHGGATDTASAARELLLERYGGAVRRYLLGLLKDSHAADDLTQEFAILVVTGKFQGADPSRGRFRNYVKTSLFHLVSKDARAKKWRPEPMASDEGVIAGLAAGDPAEDRAFVESWRTELLNRTMAALADANPNYHAVLRLKTEHAEETSEQLGARLGGPATAANVRQTLRRARELFAELLRAEVAHSLDGPTTDAVDEELAELDLLKYTKA